MKKLLLIAVCISVMMMFGCAMVDLYPIYDWDQTNKEGHGVLVNTNGKAHAMEPYLIITYWPGHAEEVIWFVDQNPANMTTSCYNYINIEPEPGYSWHDDYYCNPDWNGCSWVSSTRPIDYIDTYFPFSANWNCTWQTSGYLFSSWRYGECGRALPLADKIALLNMGELGQHGDMTGLYYNFNRTNFSVTLENQYGQTFNWPIMTDIPIFYNPVGRQVAVDRSNPIWSNMMNWYADWLDTYATDGTTVHITYMGITDSLTIAGSKGFSSDIYRAAANARY